MMFGGNKNDGISKPENENKSLEQQRLDTAYEQIKDKMQAFYEECEKQIKMSARDTRELYQEIDEKDVEIERLKQEKKAKDVLDSIGCSLATLYNTIYGLPDGDIKKDLVKCISDLNTSFRNAGCLPLYERNFEPPKDPRDENPNHEMTLGQTSDVTKIGKAAIEKMGFYIGGKPCLKMRYILYQGDSRATTQRRNGYEAPRVYSDARIAPMDTISETRSESYPFKQGADFVLKNDWMSGGYTVSFKSIKMLDTFKKLCGQTSIKIGTKYPGHQQRYIDTVYNREWYFDSLRLIIDGNVMILQLYDQIDQLIGKVALAAIR